jgi:general secretion pathway protein M
MALTLLPPPGKGKPVALGLALFVLVLFYFIFFHWFIIQHLAYADEISDLKDAENGFRQIAAQQPQLEQRIAQVAQFQAGANDFLPEDSFDLAAANLSTQLKQIIADKADKGRNPQRCQLISSQNERPTETEPYQRVMLKVHMRCDLDNLSAILFELENARPFLFVTQLTLSPRQLFQGGMPQPNLGDMDAAFDLSGYIRKSGGP